MISNVCESVLVMVADFDDELVLAPAITERRRPQSDEQNHHEKEARS